MTWIAAAAVWLAGCASVSKGIDNIRDLANHHAEQVSYPSLLDVPAKPAPSTTPAEHKDIVQSLAADKADADTQGADLRDQAANMKIIPVPGQPPAQPNAAPPTQ